MELRNKIYWRHIKWLHLIECEKQMWRILSRIEWLRAKDMCSPNTVQYISTSQWNQIILLTVPVNLKCSQHTQWLHLSQSVEEKRPLIYTWKVIVLTEFHTLNHFVGILVNSTIHINRSMENAMENDPTSIKQIVRIKAEWRQNGEESLCLKDTSI